MGVLNKQKLVTFDLNNKEHLRQVKHFYDKGRWEVSCPFEVEGDYISIPHMIADKLALAHINNKLKGKTA